MFRCGAAGSRVRRGEISDLENNDHDVFQRFVGAEHQDGKDPSGLCYVGWSKRVPSIDAPGRNVGRHTLSWWERSLVPGAADVLEGPREETTAEARQSKAMAMIVAEAKQQEYKATLESIKALRRREARFGQLMLDRYWQKASGRRAV